jgi:hypothetical protein
MYTWVRFFFLMKWQAALSPACSGKKMQKENQVDFSFLMSYINAKYEYIQ